MNQNPGIRSVSRRQSTRTNRLSDRFANRRHEKGYVMVLTAILMPLLLVLVSAATDVTFFYARGVEIQRIADTAALAGVVRMPNLPNAKKVAEQVATQNNAKSATNNMTVTVVPVSGTSRRLKVSVRDADVKLFFGRLFKDHWDISKTATAEYVSNIPLGSVLNAIGTGDLSKIDSATGLAFAAPSAGAGLHATAQNFWLTVHGPCAPKEAGDQLSTRYDGTSFNPTQPPWNVAAVTAQVNQYRVCDFATSQNSITGTSPQDYSNKLIDARWSQLSAEVADTNNGVTSSVAGATESLFPGVSSNRDYESRGYNYIIDIPCSPTAGTVLPAPCVPGDNTINPVKIEVFDPVFAPDSLQRYQNQLSATPKIKPDSYGVPPIQGLTSCGSAEYLVNLALAQDHCEGPDQTALHKVRPADVRVTTDFRVYNADETPVDYNDDLALKFADPDNRIDGIGADGVTPEPQAVAEFGSCINATDPWTSIVGATPTGATDTNHDYVPEPPAGGVQETLNSVRNQTGIEATQLCAKNAGKWRTLITLPVGSQRGRYRINVRSVSAPFSFGVNAFSIRASDTATFQSCQFPDTDCPSVAGDSTMSVFASVPNVSEFYLAQLAPAALFRGKTVVLQLWDIGEGGDTIEVMRPVDDATQCTDSTILTNEPKPNTLYCFQRFNWEVQDPGVNVLASGSATNAASFKASDALKPTAGSLGDVCTGSGDNNQLKLSVGGDWTTLPGCSTPMPALMLKSRGGFAPRVFPFSGSFGAPCGVGPYAGTILCNSGRFNDRLVNLEVQIPLNYGCAPGTGEVGSTTPCKETKADNVTARDLPANGWWKIRYTPLKPTSAGVYNAVSNPYLPMTDSTTWSVNLIGDPVHLVQNG
jgi:Flp pilus assembly protein TadG